MIFEQKRKLAIAALTSVILSLSVSAWSDGFPGGVHDAMGPRLNAGPRPPVLSRCAHTTGVDSVRYWNQIAIDASGLDHTPVAPGEDRVFGEQLGPGRASRAMAIVHIAMFDAVNAIDGGYESYTGLPPAAADTSMDAAIAQAAHDTLVALFPSQAATLRRSCSPTDLAPDPGRASRRRAGSRSAGGRRPRSSALRADDGSQHAEPRVGIDYFPSNAARAVAQDPISQHPARARGHWAGCRRSCSTSAEQFRVPPPPALDSPSTPPRSTR